MFLRSRLLFPLLRKVPGSLELSPSNFIFSVVFTLITVQVLTSFEVQLKY